MVETITIRQLRSFIKVVETNNMTRAAAELNLSQPALGIQIKNLEEGLSTQLLNRTSRGVTATAAGKYLYDRAKLIIDIVAETAATLASFEAAQNASDDAALERVSIGFTPSILKQVGPQIFLDAQFCIPGVLLNIFEGFSDELSEAMLDGKVDAAFAYDLDPTSFPAARALLDENFVLFTREKIRSDGSDEISAKEILSQRLVFQSSHGFARQAIENVAKENGLSVRVAFEVRSVEAIGGIVQNGLAAGVVPFGLTVDPVRAGAGYAYRIVEPEITRRLYVVRSPMARELQNETAVAELLVRAEEKLRASLGINGKPVRN